MSLQQTLDSLEDLHEDLHDLYEEKDGKFNLKTPDGFTRNDDLEDTSGLKSALEKERKANRESKRKLTASQEKNAGVDLDRYNKFIEDEDNAAEKKALEAGEFEKIKEQMVSKHHGEVEGLRSEVARVKAELNHEKVEKAVVETISKAGGNVELLKPHVSSRVKLNDEDFSLIVTESDGTPKVDGEGKPVNLESLVAEMSEQEVFQSAFKGTSQSGTGTDPQKGGESNSNANGGKPIQKEGLRRSTMTERQKVDFQKEHGIDALLEIPL